MMFPVITLNRAFSYVDRARLAVITLILLLAAATRIVGAGHRPVWTDEGWSVWAAGDHRIGVIIQKVAEDHHPPLYFLALSGWWTLAGDTRIALRAPAIFAGLLSVAAVYRIGADWFGCRAGRYAALLFSVLGVAVYYAQEIRHYSWLILAACLITLFLLRYLRRPRARWLIFYLLSVAFMLYTLYVGILLLAVQGVVVLLLWRRPWRAKAGVAAAWIGAALLGGPWMFQLVEHLRHLAGTGALKGFPGTYTTTFDNLLTLAGLLFGSQLALMAGLYLLGVWQMARDYRRHPVRGLAHVYLVLAGAGLYGAMALANLRIGTLTVRTTVFLTPMLMLVCGYGLSHLPRPADGLFALTAAASMLAAPGVIQPRLAYDHVMQAVAEQYSPGDPVILEAGWDDNAFKYEASLALPADDDLIIRTLPWVDHTRPDRQRPVISQLERLLQTHARVWVIQWLQPSTLIPFLDEGGYGFSRVWSQDIPTGKQYEDLYSIAPAVHVTLYERPITTSEPLSFGGILALHGALLPDRATPGSRLHVDLWWSALVQPSLDYSVGVYLMPAEGDRVIAQHDGPPGHLPTAQWKPGAPVFDRHTLILPSTLAPGTYRVAVKVYWFGDGQPLAVNARPYAIVGHIRIP